jgi:glyoxylate/hydroxypyruvate reductase A
MSQTYTILIASYLEPEYVEQIRACDPRVRVIYEPELLGKPRYIADHTAPIQRTPEQEAYWRSLLAQADILFDFDHSNISNLLELAPRLQWVQATSAGIGQLVHRHQLARTGVRFTTASGVHATALAEFCLMAMLMFVKNYTYLATEKANRHWQRYCAVELSGQTLAVIGLGRVGSEVARLAGCLGMQVIGTKRNSAGTDPASVHAHRLYEWTDLNTVLSQADFVVLSTPHTPETDQLIGEAQFAAMKRGAYFINIARGAVVNEPALIAALQSGHLAGAALDVFAVEPLPADSPFWDMPNVIISPHSASTATNENAKITEIFCDNIRRFLNNEPLRNLLDVERMY